MPLYPAPLNRFHALHASATASPPHVPASSPRILTTLRWNRSPSEFDPPTETGQSMPQHQPDVESSTPPWWAHSVGYQVYVRSFTDSDGDRIGDLPGVIEHLGHRPGSVSTLSGSPRSSLRRWSTSATTLPTTRRQSPLRLVGRHRPADRPGARTRTAGRGRPRSQPLQLRAPLVPGVQGRSNQPTPRVLHLA